MSLLSDNIIPGNHGKIFGTNAIETKDLERIKTKVLSLKGIKNVIINFEIFPREFTIYTTSIVKIEDVESKVQLTGFDIIPKDIFTLKKTNESTQKKK